MIPIKRKLEIALLLETITFSGVNFALNIFIARYYQIDIYAQFLLLQVLIAFIAVVSRSFFQEPLAILDKTRNYQLPDLISLIGVQSLLVVTSLTIGFFAIYCIKAMSLITFFCFVLYSISFSYIILIRRYYVTKNLPGKIFCLQIGYALVTFISLYIIYSLNTLDVLDELFFLTGLFYLVLVGGLIVSQFRKFEGLANVTIQDMFKDNVRLGLPIFLSNISPWMISALFVSFLSLYSENLLVQYRTTLLIYQPVAVLFGVASIFALKTFSSNAEEESKNYLVRFIVLGAIGSLIFVAFAKVGTEVVISHIFAGRIPYDQDMYLLAAFVCFSGITSIGVAYIKSLKRSKVVYFHSISTYTIGFTTVLILAYVNFSDIYLIRAISECMILFSSILLIFFTQRKIL